MWYTASEIRKVRMSNAVKLHKHTGPKKEGMLTTASTTRVCITVSGMVDGAASELLCLLISHIPLVTVIEDTVSKGGTGTNREDVAVEASTVTVAIVKLWSSLVPSGHHSSYRQTVSLWGKR